MRISSHDARWGALLAAPTVLGLLVLNVYPFVQTLALSFSRTQAFGRSTFAGLENYARMFASTEFWRATWNTVYFCLLTVPAGVLLALLTACCSIKACAAGRRSGRRTSCRWSCRRPRWRSCGSGCSTRATA